MSHTLPSAVIHALDESFAAYLQDESRLCGTAESISFPQSTQQVQEILVAMARQNMPVTIQGGRTGIVGAAVPMGGHVLNVTRMNQVLAYRQVDGLHLLEVQPGLSLMELSAHLHTLKSDVPLFWPVDSTESTATVGGVVASDAKGLSAWYYGDVAAHVDALEVVLPNGDIRTVTRGAPLAEDPTADALAVFLGSEGMLGVITRLTLLLQPKPRSIWGIAFFFASADSALQFGDALVHRLPDHPALAAAEYLERSALDIIARHQASMSKLKELPPLPAGTDAMVYLELHGQDEDSITAQAEGIMLLAQAHGSDPDTAWAVVGDAEIERMRAFRHAAAECTNMEVALAQRSVPSITKLGTDMHADNLSLVALAKGYRQDIADANLSASIFGHLPQAHLHINLLPKTLAEYDTAQALLLKWATAITAQGGCVATEHGIGKLKKRLPAPAASARLRHWKQLLDAEGLLNPQNYWNT